MKLFSRKPKTIEGTGVLSVDAIAAGEVSMGAQIGKLMDAGTVEEAYMEAVVMRCGCGEPDSHQGEVCPQAWEDKAAFRQGYWNRDQEKQLKWESEHGA